MMRISTVSEQTDLSTDTLRYYERIGLLPPINRNKNGIRDYKEIDLKRVEFIKCMRNAGLPIKSLIQYFKLLQQGDKTIEVRKDILIKQREELTSKIREMQKTLDFLNYKISVYEDAIFRRAEKEIVQIEE